MAKAPDDKKNLFRKNFPRFSVQSGQSSIHGDTNFEVQTQEAQSFAFHASTAATEALRNRRLVLLPCSFSESVDAGRIMIIDGLR